MGVNRVGGRLAMSDLTLNDVCISYGRTHAVCHLSGCFKKGSLTAIAGSNGAGKSTLVKAIMGELALTNGSIDRGFLKSQDIAYLPQAAEIDRQFPISVNDLVSLGTWAKTGVMGRLSKDSRANIAKALERVDLHGIEKRQISSLSSGQFQRILFARLLLQDAQVIILDEPFTAVDERTTNDLLQLIKQWHQEGRTVIAVLHDLEQIQQHFPNTLLLAREAVFWGDSKQALSADHRLRAKALIDYWDQPQLVTIKPTTEKTA